ncbi:CDP-glycerol glycerophosphotransferase family protein [Candidatus Haliotispira prima]|uniref:CDP-glycerol glycerophosphotransferase family protein n=1 Tax=Candidatus Haliotispira prima TaxID=3034016 RepID=A0ABY8MKK0_9SPIO|nr:CDP-glycerol glycerophosphotransferase family protein [Candidatus Haliotispira prima]
MFIVFLALLPRPLAAYLDPGTGSMLFSALVGLVSTLYFTLRSSVFTLRVKVAGLLAKVGRADSKGLARDQVGTGEPHSIVFFSEGRQYWNCFWPILRELEARQVAAAYWTMDTEDPGLSQDFRYITVRFIGKGYAAFARMNSLEADVCVMTTPGLDVLQIRRSKKVGHYSHIIHALDDCTTYRVFGTDYFDSVLLSGQHQAEALDGLEAVRNISRKQKHIVGCTYLDVLQEKLDGLRRTDDKREDAAGCEPNGSAQSCFRLLIAPSWGPNGLLAKYGLDLLRPLLDSGYRLIVRPHPQSAVSETELLTDLRTQLAPWPEQVEWDFERENIRAFLNSDAMISDFSSVICDYLILMEKPVFISEFEFNYDGYDAMDLLPREPWVIRAGREVGIPFRKEDIARLPHLLEESLQGEAAQAFRHKLAELRDYAYRYPGEAGRRSADTILQILEDAKV